jgi:hypothetical protein
MLYCNYSSNSAGETRRGQLSLDKVYPEAGCISVNLLTKIVKLV